MLRRATSVYAANAQNLTDHLFQHHLTVSRRAFLLANTKGRVTIMEEVITLHKIGQSKKMF